MAKRESKEVLSRESSTSKAFILGEKSNRQPREKKERGKEQRQE